MKKTAISLILPAMLAGIMALAPSRRQPAPEPVVAELEKIAGEYRKYELADSEYHHTIAFCDPYFSQQRVPYQAYQMSRSHEMTLMGNKLYRLWVKDMAPYPDYNKPREDFQQQPYGQAIVKESWTWDTVHVTGDREPEGIYQGTDTYLVPDKRNLLFIMYKTATREYKTDKGWVYGIYDVPNGKVLEGGVITSCRSCHERQPDRLFGINF